MIERPIAWLLERPLVIGDAIDELAAPVERRDAIVALGAPVAPSGRPSEILAERLEVAAALFHRGGAPLVVVTGGLTRGARRAEADAMAESLAALGVPPAAILVENRSRDTAENAAFVRALLPTASRLWIVTQPFHTRRAARYFRRAGFSPRMAYRAAGLQVTERRRAVAWMAREYAAWVLALVR